MAPPKDIVKVLVNGEETELTDGLSVAGLVESLGLSEQRVAVELNEDVVVRDRWPETYVRESDRIEIVQFVGGG